MASYWDGVSNCHMWHFWVRKFSSSGKRRVFALAVTHGVWFLTNYFQATHVAFQVCWRISEGLGPWHPFRFHKKLVSTCFNPWTPREKSSSAANERSNLADHQWWSAESLGLVPKTQKQGRLGLDMIRCLKLPIPISKVIPDDPRCFFPSRSACCFSHWSGSVLSPRKWGKPLWQA